MLTGKTIMILGASILQLPAIEQATEMGLKVIALDMNPDAVGFSVPGVIKEVISTIDIPAAVDAAKRHHIDGVMTLATDMPMRTVAAIARECGLPGISEETAIKATDKSVMRQELLKAGVPADCLSMKSLGYRQMAEYLTGQCDFATAVDNIKKGTRHFAKRQITWYKRMPYIQWLTVERDLKILAFEFEDINSFNSRTNL